MDNASNILKRLKEETAPLHKQIEKNEYAAAIMNNSLTMDKYEAYLIKFYGFVKPVEARLSGITDSAEGVLYESARNKSEWLERDLSALGLSEETLSRLPLCTDLPDVSTHAKALGCLYVLEGSTLGGQMIIRMLAKYLPVDPHVNGNYFNSYGDSTREHWKAFCSELEKAADRPEAEEEMIQAAKNTFRLLDRWFVEPEASQTTDTN
ncbi:biliverdin-producing heme oxygenase [Paenibacillus sp. PK3_47]|uniref:biliverdin-producing heme oxygenase n=1 Tax=Paenibacillus sp. PK3_47 TaxID=2072642 RepID=UPI00201E6485|nr:biliverdin-producing heme oxygenase [Paenibacillus sp. PK3_47]UQZ37010.1 biliverdin-producing heme oxygenase [Paenibacillus sp. PK3_47]